MFEDHVADLFGLEFEEWMEQNHVIGEFVSWSEVEILPDNHPEHDRSLEEYMEDEETAVNLIANNGHIIITLTSGKIVEKSDDFPENLLGELKDMAINGPFKIHLKKFRVVWKSES
ncbi:MAG: hypothetical protein ACKVIR_08165 [Candidatus Poseidoniales archaeon]